MLNGAIVKEIQAKVPEQFRPKGTDENRFSQAFVSAMNGVGTDPAAQAAQERLRWEYLAAHADGYELLANKTGPGLAMFANLGEQERAEKKKREDEEREYAARNAVTAMKERLQNIADEWGKIADEYERKLGGINKIGDQLGVKRKPDQSEEEYRRLVNEMVLRKIASGEIDPNSDMAAMAQARDNRYQALEQRARLGNLLEEAEETGDYSEFNRERDKAKQSEIMLREGLEKHRAEFREEFDAEVIERDAVGEAGKDTFEDVASEETDLLGFLEEEDFAASAVAMDVTGCFNNAATCAMPETEPVLAVNTVQVGVFRPTGMMNG